MKLAFYYHIPIVAENQALKVPGYLGVFIDALANAVDELHLVMHQARPHEKAEADYTLKANNIVWVDLGLKTPAWHRAIFHNKLLKNVLRQIEGCEVFLVRSPSPLAPYFHHYLKNTRLVFLVVGDYAESVEQTGSKTFREFIINLYLKHNDFLFRKHMKNTDVVVNSPALFDKYKNISKSIHQIKTTTLSATDFFYRTDTCLNTTIELLYTGRIDPLKGLVELIEAVAVLKSRYPNLRLNLVGWESITGNPVEQMLKKVAEKNDVTTQVVFHGKKTIGQDLNQMYKMADIYVIPSYEEGFPRTIWEAMANSLPVVATTVGAIPRYLSHQKDAMLIKPKSTTDIVNAIIALIENTELRKTLIRNGMIQAENNTLEFQTKQLLAIINQLT